MFKPGSIVSDVKSRLAQAQINIKEEFQGCPDPKAKADQMIKKYQEVRGLSLPRDVYNEVKDSLLSEFSKIKKESHRTKVKSKTLTENSRELILCGLSTFNEEVNPYDDSEEKVSDEEDYDSLLDLDDDLMEGDDSAESDDKEGEEEDEVKENSSESDNMVDPEDQMDDEDDKDPSDIRNLYKEFMSEGEEDAEDSKEDSEEDAPIIEPNQAVDVDGRRGVVLSVDEDMGTAKVSFTSDYDEQDSSEEDDSITKDIQEISLDDISLASSDDQNKEEKEGIDESYGDDDDSDQMGEEMDSDDLNLMPFGDSLDKVSDDEEEENLLDVDDDLMETEEEENLLSVDDDLLETLKGLSKESLKVLSESKISDSDSNSIKSIRAQIQKLVGHTKAMGKEYPNLTPNQKKQKKASIQSQIAGYRSRIKSIRAKYESKLAGKESLKLEFTKVESNPSMALGSRVLYAGQFTGTVTKVEGDVLTVKLDTGKAVRDGFSQFEVIDPSKYAEKATIGESVRYEGIKGKLIKVEGKTAYVKFPSGATLKTEMSSLVKEDEDEEATNGESNTGTKPYPDQDIDAAQADLDNQKEEPNTPPDARGPEVKTADNTEDLAEDLEDLMDTEDEEEAKFKLESLNKKYSNIDSKVFFEKVTKLTKVLSKGRLEESKRLVSFLAPIKESFNMAEPVIDKLGEMVSELQDNKTMSEIVKMIQEMFRSNFGIEVGTPEATKILSRVLEKTSAPKQMGEGQLAVPCEEGDVDADDTNEAPYSDSEEKVSDEEEVANLLDVDKNLTEGDSDDEQPNTPEEKTKVSESEEESDDESDSDKDIEDLKKVDESDEDDTQPNTADEESKVSESEEDEVKDSEEEDEDEKKMPIAEAKGFLRGIFSTLSLIPEQTLKNSISKVGKKPTLHLEQWAQAGYIVKRGSSYSKGKNLA